MVWCGQGMISRKDNVIELPIRIKGIAHEANGAQYPIITVDAALVKFLTFKQSDDMSLVEYMPAFKENRDIVKTQSGTKWLNYFVTQQPEFLYEQDPAVKAKLKDGARGSSGRRFHIDLQGPNLQSSPKPNAPERPDDTSGVDDFI
jgi:hypothetical protein